MRTHETLTNAANNVFSFTIHTGSTSLLALPMAKSNVFNHIFFPESTLSQLQIMSMPLKWNGTSKRSRSAFMPSESHSHFNAFQHVWSSNLFPSLSFGWMVSSSYHEISKHHSPRTILTGTILIVQKRCKLQFRAMPRQRIHSHCHKPWVNGKLSGIIQVSEFEHLVDH